MYTQDKLYLEGERSLLLARYGYDAGLVWKPILENTDLSAINS